MNKSRLKAKFRAAFAFSNDCYQGRRAQTNIFFQYAVLHERLTTLPLDDEASTIMPPPI